MKTLRAEHLAKSYKRRRVVQDISLSIEQGRIVGLLGPNGAGKTTSFYMIVGLVRADAGAVHIDDRDLSTAAMHERARAGIGYLPQEASIFRKLSVADNIMAILETRRDLDRAGRQRRLEELLEDFHVTHIRDNLGMSLSGASAAAWRSPGRWPPSPPSSSSTNPSRGSTRSRWARSRASSASSRRATSGC